MDAVASGGQSRFLAMLNLAFAEEATRRTKLLLQDVHGISANIGLRSTGSTGTATSRTRSC